MGRRIEKAARCFLHEVSNGGNFKIAMEVGVSLKPPSANRLADEAILNHLKRVKVAGGCMCKRYRCVGHDWANASFVKCRLISKGHFTPLAEKGVEAAQNKGRPVAHALDVGSEGESGIQGHPQVFS